MLKFFIKLNCQSGVLLLLYPLVSPYTVALMSVASASQRVE